MGFAEKRATYWRGRYKVAPGKHLTVVDERGKAIKFATKGEAQRAASEAENKYRRGDWRDPALGQETFGEYANRWYASQDLAASTMQNYRRHIEEHLLPEFEDKALAGILRTDVDLWEKKEKAALYAASSVKTWRSTLHLIFEDAIDEGLIASNPAARRRGRGKRAGRSRDRGPEKVVTDPLGILLTAERAALLSGRDDEFVAVVLKGYTGMRWGEIVGLETGFARPGSVRVEWQLYELDTGELVRCPRRTTATAPSTRRTGWPPWSPTTSLVRNPRRAPAMARSTSSEDKGRRVRVVTKARSSSTSLAGPAFRQAPCPTPSTTPSASPKPRE